jgi:hypothetical protein
MGTKNAIEDQDAGNVIALEHVNIAVPDQRLATLFYLAGLGATRDPYMMVGLENMWINVGEQQFHLPNREAQVIPGHIGIVVEDLAALQDRLAAIEEGLAGTRFQWSVHDGYVAATGPWGNQFHCHPPGPEFGDMLMGIPYVEFRVRPGVADGIGQFYKQLMGASYSPTRNGEGGVARVRVGRDQELVFRETAEPIPPYDGHHVAIYTANFSSPYAELKRRDLVTEEVDSLPANTSRSQYRFRDIVDPKTGELLLSLEHEVRSLYHPMYLRPLVTRNPSQSIRGYSRGRDALTAAP